jgi:hypothetical protein
MFSGVVFEILLEDCLQLVLLALITILVLLVACVSGLRRRNELMYDV